MSINIKLFSLAIAILFLLNCSERERLNPLDPHNPNTHGAPQNIRLYSNRQKAVLSWNPIDVNSIIQYYIFKSENDSTTLVKYDSVAANQTQYSDTSIQYDSQYYYSVQAVTETDTSRKSEVVSLTPGRYNFLLADFYDHRILELSYDGNYIIRAYNNISSTGIEIVDDQIFFIDMWAKNLQTIHDGSSITMASLGAEPVELITNSSENRFYIGCRDTDELLTVSIRGDIISRQKLSCDVNFSTRMAFDSVYQNIWITSRDSNKIYLHSLNEDSTYLVSDEFDSPNEIEIDELGRAWIASVEGIVRVNTDLGMTRFLEDYYIYDIARNPDGDVYYSGVDNETSEIGVIYSPVHSQTQDVIFRDKYNYIVSLTCIPEKSGTGLLLINAWTGEVYRINSDGKQIGDSVFIYSIEDVALY